MTFKNILWEFARGDFSASEFEKFIYENDSLKKNIDDNLYLQLLEANYNDKNIVEDLKKSIINFLLEKTPPQCKCILTKNLDRVQFGTQFTEDLFSTFKEIKKRGENYWWLSLYKCEHCNNHWLAAQDESHDDFFLMRLNENIIKEIIRDSLWPSIFNDYEGLQKVVLTSSRFSEY